MSRFKDLGSFGQQFINQIANEIRSNAEHLVSGAFQTENPDRQSTVTSGRTAPDQHSSSSSASSPSGRERPTASTRGPGLSSTSSSEATTPDEVASDWFSSFVRSGPAGTSMGNGGLCGSRHTSTVKPADEMVCDICLAKFTLFNRKKLCSECKSYFCGTCVSREAPSGRRGQAALNSRTCKRCKILLSDPPVRADLMELRVKDLQRYLISKKVNTKSCVEKKDLVELIIRQSGGEGEGSSATATAESAAAPGPSASNIRRKVPEERQRSFPNSYVESTHRHDWLEKLEAGHEIPLSCEEDDDNFIVVTPVEPLNNVEESEDQRPPSASVVEEDNKNEQCIAASEQTPVEAINNADADVNCVDEDDESSGETLVGAGALPTPSNQTENQDQCGGDAKPEPIKAPNLSMPNICPSPISGSPRRFANQGLVYLSEIQSLEDVQELSVKQAKDILAMNRVNFKGVVEKDELLKYVARLWKQEKQAQVEKESMSDCDLCKICMDNPVDCVMLECGHMCTCTTCGKQMAECPICRQYVVRVVRTFKA